MGPEIYPADRPCFDGRQTLLAARTPTHRSAYMSTQPPPFRWRLDRGGSTPQSHPYAGAELEKFRRFANVRNVNTIFFEAKRRHTPPEPLMGLKNIVNSNAHRMNCRKNTPRSEKKCDFFQAEPHNYMTYGKGVVGWAEKLTLSRLRVPQTGRVEGALNWGSPKWHKSWFIWCYLWQK